MFQLVCVSLVCGGCGKHHHTEVGTKGGHVFILVKPALTYLTCCRGTAVGTMYTPGTKEFLGSGAVNDMWDVLECGPAMALGSAILHAHPLLLCLVWPPGGGALSLSTLHSTPPSRHLCPLACRFLALLFSTASLSRSCLIMACHSPN